LKVLDEEESTLRQSENTIKMPNVRSHQFNLNNSSSKADFSSHNIKWQCWYFH